MIRQSELKAVVALRKELAELERRPEVAEFVGVQLRAEGLLAALRVRAAAGEAVQAGPWALSVRTSLTVSWQRAYEALRAIPGVALAIARDVAAGRVVASVAERDPTSGLVAPRIRVDVVKAGAGG